MKSTTANTVSIGPGVLEDIIVDALKSNGTIPADAITPVLTFHEKNTWSLCDLFSGSQRKAHVNQVRIEYKQPIDVKIS